MESTAHQVASRRSTPPSAPLSAPNRGKVLIVEDNAINQRVAVILATKLGFTVDVADDGSVALKMAGEKFYDLILMDCQMPVMDGFEATKAIRALGTAISGVPIIAVTANVMEGQREKCLANGMNDYIAKPINREILSHAVDKWLPPGHAPKLETAQALTA